MLLQLIVLAGIFWGLFEIGVHHAAQTKATITDRTAESLGFAIIWTIVFVVLFGYFIAFEAFWNGQTPGKKLLGIRVVREGGYPIDLGASFIRNLIRAGELALAFYAVSAIAALVSPENKRLGDMAAGTLVVRDSPAQSLSKILAQADAPPSRIAMLSDDEHAIVARFIARRGGMDPHHRRALAFQIADRVRKRVSSDLQRLDDEELLERLNASS